MMGAVSVIAKFTLPGDTSQVAARLVDVAPDHTETLVDRGLWRPATGGPTKQVFQLHPNGWTFAAGHAPKLELIASDAADAGGLTSYGRRSDDQQAVTVSNLEVRIPVLEKPARSTAWSRRRRRRFLPDGYDLAADFAALPTPKAEAGRQEDQGQGRQGDREGLLPGAFKACTDVKLSLKATGKRFQVGSAKLGQSTAARPPSWRSS